MKKALPILLMLFLCTTVGYAQFTGGGKQENSAAPAKKTKKAKKDSDGFKALLLGIATPTGAFNRYDLNSNSWGETVGASTGFVVAYVGGAPIDLGLELPQEVKLGITYNLATTIFTLDAEYSTDLNEFHYIPLVLQEVKMGPYASYQLSDNIAFDAFWRLGPRIAYGLTYGWDEGGYEDSSGYTYASSYIYNLKGANLRINSALGITARLSNFYLSFERVPGMLNATFSLKEDYTEIETKEVRLPVGHNRLTFGLTW